LQVTDHGNGLKMESTDQETKGKKNYNESCNA
jgi:hypothetical protein